MKKRNGFAFYKADFNFSPPCSGELVQIMMATANENLSAKFCNRVLKFFTKLFQLSKLLLNLFCSAFVHILYCSAIRL